LYSLRRTAGGANMHVRQEIRAVQPRYLLNCFTEIPLRCCVAIPSDSSVSGCRRYSTAVSLMTPQCNARAVFKS
jgi:hypothetical protein